MAQAYINSHELDPQDTEHKALNAGLSCMKQMAMNAAWPFCFGHDTDNRTNLLSSGREFSLS